MLKYFQIFSSLLQVLNPWITLGKAKCQQFQKQHPLCLCALYWLAGSLSRNHTGCAILILVCLHPFLSRHPKQWISQGLCWLIPLIWTPPSTLPHEGPASGTFNIKYAGYGDVYYGEATELCTLYGRKTNPLPCKIFSKTRLQPNLTYRLQGTLHHTPQIIFKSNACCEELLKPNPLTLKQKLRRHAHTYLCTLFPKGNSGAFTSSLLLGTPLPKELSSLFRRKGLSHLFAVSGWHFSLLATLLGVLFSTFPLKLKNLLSLGILTLATLVLPSSPSVFRAWISITLTSLSPYVLGSCSGLNRLGCGFILCSCFFSSLSPAFALSFLATLGIQLFFLPIFSFLYTPWTILIPSRYLTLWRYFLSTLSLTLSAQTFIFFPIIGFFGSFVLDGLIYNLFFPLILLPILLLILSSLLFPFLAPLTETLISWVLSHPYLHSKKILSPLSFTAPSPFLLTGISLTLFFLGVFLIKLAPSHHENSPTLLNYI